MINVLAENRGDGSSLSSIKEGPSSPLCKDSNWALAKKGRVSFSLNVLGIYSIPPISRLSLLGF